MILGDSPEKISGEMIKLYVLDLVRRGIILAGTGGEILEVHLTDFVKIMDQHNVPYFNELPENPDDVDSLISKAGEG